MSEGDLKVNALEELRQYLNTNQRQEGDFTLAEAIKYFGLGREQVRIKLNQLVAQGVYEKIYLPGNVYVYRKK